MSVAAAEDVAATAGDGVELVGDWRRGSGVGEADGDLWGVGPDYRVRFAEGRVEFTPAFGSGATRTYPVVLALNSYGRGSDVRVAVSSLASRSSDDMVVYRRGDITERYQVRPEGVELSLVFGSRPDGNADLFVRYRVDTDLMLDSSATGPGVTLRRSGLGGVQIGGVTGVDARGRTVSGGIALRDGALELSLPASFVDAASYPMVLDPLVTPFVDVAVVSNDDELPDVAFDSTNDAYLVVWQRRFSVTDTDIRGQRVLPNGTLLGGVIPIRTTIGVLSAAPSVANVNVRDRFLVAWTEANAILCSSVAASNGAVSAVATVIPGVSTILAACPDVGGEATLVDDEALVVWLDFQLVSPFSRTVFGKQVTIQSDGTCVPFAALVTIASGETDNCPTISKSGGGVGRYLVTWERDFSTSDSEVRGAVVDRNLTILDSFIAITSNTSEDSAPDNDGDGSRWLVAFERETTAGSGDRDIVAIPVDYNPGTGIGSSSGVEVVIEGDLNDDEKSPSVGWLGESVLIAYSDVLVSGGTDYDTYVESVDPFTGLPCEGEYGMETGSTADADWTAIATQRSGDSGTAGQGALIAWQSDDASGSSDIRGARFTAEDGMVADLGGGCGDGGEAFATSVVVGNSAFTHHLVGAVPNAMGYLIVSQDTVSAPCGSCTLVPNPFTGFLFLAATGSTGKASIPTPIPNVSALAGLTFVEQWFVVNPSPACVAFGGDLSNALGVAIQ